MQSLSRGSWICLLFDGFVFYVLHSSHEIRVRGFLVSLVLRHWSALAATMAFSAKCSVCGWTFKGWKQTVASFSARRHEAQKHGKHQGKMQRGAVRLKASRRYKTSTRASGSPVQATIKKKRLQNYSNTLAMIVCPRRREVSHQLFSKTRTSFLMQGFPKERIRRTLGIDPDAPPPQLTKEDLKKRNMLTAYFVKSWVPRATRILASRPELKYVLWVEDDCLLLEGGLREFFLALRKSSKPVWGGYYPLKPNGVAKPTNASHLVCQFSLYKFGVYCTILGFGATFEALSAKMAAGTRILAVNKQL